MEPTSELSTARSSEAIDMISDLPKDMRETIIAYLPTKEAGRTSVLSSKWRHTWKSIPDLVIHCDNNVEPAKTINLVDEILALHDGPIRKFDLLATVDSTVNCADVFDRWFYHLSRNGIKELNLQLKWTEFGSFAIPSSFSSCSFLNFLSLHCGNIDLPVEYYGFKFVRTLEINAYLPHNDLPKLISNCHMLENLTIHNYISLDYNTRISAQNLKKLFINHCLCFIDLCAPKLLFLCLDYVTFWGPAPVIDLNKFFSNVSNLETLELRDQCIENLIDKSKLDAGKFVLNFLNELWLDMEYFEEENIKFVQPLFHNGPNLRVFHLNVRLSFDNCKIQWLSKDQKFWNSMNEHDFSLRSVQVIDLHGFGRKDRKVLPFLKFVLGSAHKLRKIIINFEKNCGLTAEMWLKYELLSMGVSTKAQIIFQAN